MFLDEKKHGEAKTTNLTQRVLFKAAEIIEARGLKQHGFGGRTADESVCVLRAFELAAKDLGLGKEYNAWGGPRAAVMRYANCDSVANWTDAKGRTQAEVIGVLRGAAAL